MNRKQLTIFAVCIVVCCLLMWFALAWYGTTTDCACDNYIPQHAKTLKP